MIGRADIHARAQDADGLTIAAEFGRELVDLALSADGSVLWSVRFADGKVSWMAGLDVLVGLAGRPHDEVSARLTELIEPLWVAAQYAPVWQDFELEQRCDDERVLRFRARTYGQEQAGGLVGIAIDVTQSRQERQALADLADRYRLLVELSPVPVCVHQDGEIAYANPSLVNLLGAESSAQIVGHSIGDFVDPVAIPAMRQRIEAMSAPGAVSEPAEVQLMRVDGGRAVVESMSVRTTWQGRSAYQVILRDVTTQRAAEAALRYRATLVQHVSDAIIATTWDGVVTSWNPAAEDVYGVTAEQAAGKHVSDLVGARLVPAEVFGEGGLTQAQHRHQDGSPLAIRVSVAQMPDGYVLVCADETARWRAQQHFATVVAALDEGVVVVGASGLVESVNPAATRILGIREADLVGSSPLSWPMFGQDSDSLSEGTRSSLRTRTTGQPHNSEILQVRRPDGSSVWLALNCRALVPDEPPPHPIVMSFTDITERVRHTEMLHYQATHDELTGLPNRKGINELLAELLAQGADQLAVLFCDIDNFKRVNDSLGHEAGDELLAALARRLRNGLPEKCTAARLSGDEFLVICSDIDAVGGIDALTRWVSQFLRTVVPVRDQLVSVSASTGAALLKGSMTVEDLLRHADAAMFNAKSQGPGRVSLASQALISSVEGQLRLEEELRDALAKDALAVHYQPIVDRHGVVVSAEALVRWPHPQRGDLSPDVILPVAKQGDLERELDLWVLRTALREAAGWQPRDGRRPRVAVNLAGLLPDDPAFVEEVSGIIADSGIEPGQVILEMVESALVDLPRRHRRAMDVMIARGVQFAVDDFGTGYSSLARLKDLPAQIIKLDRRFVSAVDSDPADLAIARAVVDMASAMGRRCVAEGVETPSQFQSLDMLGIDYYQGWLFSRPLSREQMRGLGKVSYAGP